MIIIGGGPAGISAAIWCGDLGLSSIILERSGQPYGQLRSIHNPIENYPGILARNGAELIEHFQRSVSHWKLNIETGLSIVSTDCHRRVVTLEDGRELDGRALVIATGVRRKTLGIPGEDEFRGRGVLGSGAGERETVTGKRVVVVGGGDAAVENALILADYADEVTLVHRRQELTSREEFLERLNADPKIRVLFGSEVTRIGGDERVRFAEVSSDHAHASIRVDTDFFIARLGYIPNSELVAEQLTTDPKGYLLVDNECRTSLPDIYAIGDVASHVSPTIATAVGMGATAAKSIYSLLKLRKTV